MEETKYPIVWEYVNWGTSGGQQINLNDPAARLRCDEVGFSITVRAYRSQLKNKELAYTLFELYLDEIKNGK